MEVRKCGLAALAAALALACAAPPGLAHAEQLVRTYAQGEAVPGELELNGEEYALESWEPGGGLDAATRSFERTAYKTLPTSDYGGDPASCFDAQMEIAEEGFSGAIPLVNAKAEVSAAHPERSDYEETVEFSYITKAELDALPDERAATVAGTRLTLSKLDVKADRVPSDPGTEIYSGQAVYGIHEQHDVADEYRLTATYAGELSRGATPVTVVATYSPKAPESAPQADEPVPTWEPQAEGPNGPDLAAFAPAGIGIAACAALSAACLVAARRRRGGGGSEADGEEEEGEGAGPGGAGRPEEEEVNDADH